MCYGNSVKEVHYQLDRYVVGKLTGPPRENKNTETRSKSLLFSVFSVALWFNSSLSGPADHSRRAGLALMVTTGSESENFKDDVSAWPTSSRIVLRNASN